MKIQDRVKFEPLPGMTSEDYILWNECYTLRAQSHRLGEYIASKFPPEVTKEESRFDLNVMRSSDFYAMMKDIAELVPDHNRMAMAQIIDKYHQS